MIKQEISSRGLAATYTHGWDKHRVDRRLNYPKNGTIGVMLTGNEDNVGCLVVDNGTAISPEERIRIFERFHKWENQLEILKAKRVRLLTVSDAHRLADTGINIRELKEILENERI